MTDLVILPAFMPTGTVFVFPFVRTSVTEFASKFCVKLSQVVYISATILSQKPNATPNKAECNRSKFSRKTKMTNISQQQPINILKPLMCSD